MSATLKSPMTSLLLLALAGCFWQYPLSAQQAAETAAENPLLARQIERRWKLHWYKFGKHCAKVDGRFVICHTYDNRYPSSVGLTAKQARAEESKKVQVRSGIIIRTVTIKPDSNDIDAYVKALPQVAAGEYGYIHSAKIVSKQGPFAMTISDIWVVDEKEITKDIKEKTEYIESRRQAVQREYDRQRRIYDQQRAQQQRSQSSRTGTSSRSTTNYNRLQQPNFSQFDQALKDLERRYKHRTELIEQQNSNAYQSPILVIGHPTAGLRPGTRWRHPKSKDGLQLAIVGKLVSPSESKTSTLRGRSNTMLVAVPASKFRNGLTEEEFLALVTEAGVTKKAFVDKVVEAMQEYPNQPEFYEPIVVEMLIAGLNESEVAQAEGAAAATDATADADKPGATDDSTGAKPLTYAEKRALAREKRRGSSTADTPDTAKPAADADTKKPLTYAEKRALAREKRRGGSSKTTKPAADDAKPAATDDKDTSKDTSKDASKDATTKKPLTYKEQRELARKLRREKAAGDSSKDEK